MNPQTQNPADTAQQPVASFEAYEESRKPKPDAEIPKAEPAVAQPEPTSVNVETTEGSEQAASKPKRDRTAEGRIAELTARAKQLEAERDEWRSKATPKAEPQQAQPKPAADGRPLLKDFVAKLGPDEVYEDAHEKWTEALTDWRETKRTEREAGERQQATQRETAAKVQTKVTEAREKYDDFDTVTEGDWITPAMQEYLLEADNLDVIYHLGANRDEVARISALPKARQLAELGKIEDRLAKPEPKPAPPVSKAPAPIRAVGGTAADPVDPLKATSFEAYERARQKQKK